MIKNPFVPDETVVFDEGLFEQNIRDHEFEFRGDGEGKGDDEKPTD